MKDLRRRHKVQVAVLQESKLHEVSDRIVAEIWGRRHVKWVAVDAVGAAGGLLLMWDTRSVTVLDSWHGAFSHSVLVEDQTNNSKWLLTSVYGPNNSQRRVEF